MKSKDTLFTLAVLTLLLSVSVTVSAAPAWLKSNKFGFSCSTPEHRRAGAGFRSPYRFRPLAAHPARMAGRYQPAPAYIRPMPGIHPEQKFNPHRPYQRMHGIANSRTRPAYPYVNRPMARQNPNQQWRRYPITYGLNHQEAAIASRMRTAKYRYRPLQPALAQPRFRDYAQPPGHHRAMGWLSRPPMPPRHRFRPDPRFPYPQMVRQNQQPTYPIQPTLPAGEQNARHRMQQHESPVGMTLEGRRTVSANGLQTEQHVWRFRPIDS